MINDLYEQLLVASNKDQRGKITPDEFNLGVNNIVFKIYSEFIDEYKVYASLQNKYAHGSGDADKLKFYQQLLEYYTVLEKELTKQNSDKDFSLPDNWYFTKVVTDDSGVVISKTSIDRYKTYQNTTIASPSNCYPLYIQHERNLQTTLETNTIVLTYLRKPKQAKWTYVVIGDNPQFNPSSPDYNDIDIHPDLQQRIYTELLEFFGLNIREQEMEASGQREETERYQKSKNQ